MPGRIPEHILDDILSRIDIVELVSGYIPLKRAGRNFKALCPFHHEKTASFMVSPERQIYHCFGCGQSGNGFKFLMSYERMDFPEAVETLAKKAQVTLPQPQQQDYKTVSLITQLYKVNELASLYYENLLNTNGLQGAKNYLLKRGLKEETMRLFKLGFAPDRWDGLINHLRVKNISISLMEKAGLVLSKEKGGYYDRFRSRIIFPIMDIKSRVLGFGARVLPAPSNVEGDNTLPKYVNSPETPIYIKGRNLYGLNLAKDAIRDKDYAVMVEGYLDFIIPYQEGLQNIVASLGTALTYEQVRLLKRYTHNLIMIYDADDAGQLATLRSLDILIEEGINVKVASLTPGYDPDLFVRKNGMENFRRIIDGAENLFDYKLRILKSCYAHREIEGKAKISAEMLSTINKFKNAVLKSEYIKRLAQDLDVKEDALLQELRKIKDNTLYPDETQANLKKPKDINPTEKLLIKLALEETELIHHIRQRLEPSDFQDERISRIVSIMFDLLEEGKNIQPKNLMNYVGDEDMLHVISESAFMPEGSLEDKKVIVDDCIRRLKSKNLVLKKQRLHEEIKTAQTLGDEEKLKSLMQEFHNLVKGSF